MSGNRSRAPRRRQTRRAILVVTNGKQTEDEYLHRLKNLGPDTVAMKIVCEAGADPMAMLRTLSSRKYDLSAYHEIWLVVDADGADRTEFLRECQRRDRPNLAWVGVVSQPCFEVWLNAHYEQVRNYADQTDAQRHYASLVPAGTPKKHLPKDFPIENAGEAATRCHLRGVSPAGRNETPPSPGTTMPLLLEALGLKMTPEK